MNIVTKELNSFFEAVKFRYGYDFTDYALSSIKRRVKRVMVSDSINTLHELGARILQDEEYFETFIREVTVNVTELFRNPSFYKALRETVIPVLATYPHIKVWIAGCATGEEVYTIAIILKEANLYDRSIIYATDINQEVLNKAKKGVYRINDMQTYSKNYMQAGGKSSFSEYYQAKYGHALMEKSLSKNVVFSAHNLCTDQPFNEFNLILCRNVMIYFNETLQDKVVGLFNRSLCPLGFLCLGDKESLYLNETKKPFKKVGGGENIYRKVN